MSEERANDNSSPLPCSVFAKAFPCEEEGEIECRDCRHTHHCGDMEDRRNEIRDAFIAGINQNVEMAKLAKAFTQGVIVGMSEPPNVSNDVSERSAAD